MVKIMVIGGGPGGYPAALKAASLGAEVTIVEKNKVGGVCLHCGCIPSKSLLDAAHRFEVIRSLSPLCQDGAATSAQALLNDLSWPKIQARQKAVTQKLSLGLLGLFKAKKVNYICGEASFINAREALVKTADGEQKISFDYAIVATGSEAFFPPPFNAVKELIYDNSTIFDMPRLPKTLTIIGAGAIGCEFAEMMNAFGVQVHLVEMQDRLLPSEDEGLSRILTQSFLKRGIGLYMGKSAAEVHVNGDEKRVTLNDGTVLESDAILAAIGRTVDLTALRLDNVGVEWTRKGVRVNPQTLQVKENIYAVGDVNGLCLLAHAATRQGEVAARVICGQKALYDNNAIARAIYTKPEIASVGVCKKQAEQQNRNIKTQKAFLLANGRAQTQDETAGFFEILSDPSTGQIVGANLCGAGASEIIHILSVALAAGMSVDAMKEVVFAHPTLSESLGEALNK